MSVTLHTTAGDLKLEIYCDTAPRTAFNFLALCASGAYDGTIFHRNIKGFMVQGTIFYTGTWDDPRICSLTLRQAATLPRRLAAKEESLSGALYLFLTNFIQIIFMTNVAF